MVRAAVLVCGHGRVLSPAGIKIGTPTPVPVCRRGALFAVFVQHVKVDARANDAFHVRLSFDDYTTGRPWCIARA